MSGYIGPCASALQCSPSLGHFVVFSQLIVLQFCNTAKMYKDQFMWLTLIQLLNTLVIQF